MQRYAGTRLVATQLIAVVANWGPQKRRRALAEALLAAEAAVASRNGAIFGVIWPALRRVGAS